MSAISPPDQASASSSRPARSSSSPKAPKIQTRQSHASFASVATTNTSSGGDGEINDDAGSEATAPAQTLRDVSQAFRSGRPSAYHMAVVTLLGSLASGMPLASMFKVYTYIMCEVYDPTIRDEPPAKPKVHALAQAMRTLFFSASESSISTTTMKLPPAPELPNPPRCSLPWVQKSTSSYSAAMVTMGALLGLMSLSRASTLARRFGRKPLLVISHMIIAAAILVFRFAVVLPPIAGAVVLYIAVVVSEASAGAPLRIAIQNYVVDTTSEAQRAGALSFIEGFGQIGAFPSSALGGLLASLTGEFFAPFYADCGLMILAIAYLVLLVPESKSNAETTFVENWFHHDQDQDPEQQPENGQRDTVESPSAIQDEHRRRSVADSQATYDDEHIVSDDSPLKWRSRLKAINFLRPLAIFWPRRRHYTPTTEEDVIEAPLSDEQQQSPPHGSSPPAHLSTAFTNLESRMDFRLLNLAAVVVFEETYQAFMVPLLLLYNSERFGFDVLQNGYLISILQSTRALFLTAIFPPAVALARTYVAKIGLARRKEQVQKLKREAKRKRKRKAANINNAKTGTAAETQTGAVENENDSTTERTALLRGRSTRYDSGGSGGGGGGVAARDYGTTDVAAEGGSDSPSASSTLVQGRPARRRPSSRSAASFGYSNLRSHHHSGKSSENNVTNARMDSKKKRDSTASYFTIGSSNWETHSIFASTPTELIKKIQRGKLDISIMLASYSLAFISFLVMASSAKAPSSSPRPSELVGLGAAQLGEVPVISSSTSSGLWWSTPWIPLVLSIVLLQLSSGSTSVRTALVVNAVSEEDQTKALAAHQILVTVVAAIVPLLTSVVFGAALEKGHPEFVWLFKASFALLAAVGAGTLFWSHKGFYEKAHDEEDDDDEEHNGNIGNNDQEEEDD